MFRRKRSSWHNKSLDPLCPSKLLSERRRPVPSLKMTRSSLPTLFCVPPAPRFVLMVFAPSEQRKLLRIQKPLRLLKTRLPRLNSSRRRSKQFMLNSLRARGEYNLSLNFGFKFFLPSEHPT